MSHDPPAFGDLFCSRPFLRLEASHPLKYLLKFLQSKALLLPQLLKLRVKTPKILVFFLLQQAIQLILLSCVLKGQFPSHQGEENDSQGKDISLGSIVPRFLALLALMNLRRHIGLSCALVLIEHNHLPILPKTTGKPKITNLDAQRSALKTHQHILQLEIPMRNPLPVKVRQPGHDPPEASPFFPRVKPVTLQIHQKRSFLGIFEYKYILRLSELFIHFITLKGNFLLISKSLYDVLMIEGSKHKEFVVEMRLLLPTQRGDYLQHHPRLALTVCEQLGTGTTADQRQLVLTHDGKILFNL